VLPNERLSGAIAHFLTQVGWDEEPITLVSVMDDDLPYFAHFRNDARDINVYLHTIIVRGDRVLFYDARVVPEWGNLFVPVTE
jgi:hypothetical protein